MIGPIILQIVLIFLNATFASAEIAVISMNDNKLKRMAAEGDKRAVRLSALTAQPARFLATIQVAITLAGLLGSAFAADSFAGPLVDAMMSWGITVPANVLKSVSVILITLILAYFNLVFGELVPKRIAMKKAESLALGMSGLLH
ncbi:MAG: CNNM domain-containing protein, partial [Emergencia timonensis]